MSLKLFKEKDKNILISRLLILILITIAIGIIIIVAHTQNLLLTLIVFFYSILSIAIGYWDLKNLPKNNLGKLITQPKNIKEKQILAILEELKIAAGYKKPIKLYIIPDDMINAFAYTLNDKAVISINKGAVDRLNRDEMSALMGHEISHIINKDSDVKVSAYLILVFIGTTADILWNLIKHSKKNIRIALILPAFISLVFLIVAKLIFYALLRRREALADVEAVRLTRNKQAMISLLTKLLEEERSYKKNMKLTEKIDHLSNIKQSFYFWDISGLFSSHPPLEERIKIIKQL